MTFVLSIIVIVLCYQVYGLSKRLKKIEEAVKPKETEPVQVVKKSISVEESTTVVNAEPKVEVKAEPKVEVKAKPRLEVKAKPKREVLWAKNLFTVESIITKLGILLLLIGVGYIFKLAYDSGYITQELILLGGALFGFVLIGLSYRVKKKKRLILGQVLAGGGIATLYITTYAAYQGYDIIPGILAFIFMCVITFIAFFIAVTDNSLSISIVGIMGGLLTPFVLQYEQLGIEGTGLYIAVLALSAMIIFIIKGWRTLQLSSIVGTYIVTTYFLSYPNMTSAMSVKLLVLFITILLIYNVTEFVLMIHEKVTLKHPMISYGVISSLPIITLMQSVAIIDASDRTWGIGLVIVAFVYMLLTTYLYRKLGDTYISNITLSFIAFFGFLSLLMFFGAAIEAIAVMALGILYLLLNKKWEGFYVGLLGRILIGIGFIMAFVTMIMELIDHSPSIQHWLTRAVIIALMMVTAFITSKEHRKIIVSLNVLGYAFVAYIGQVIWWFDNDQLIAFIFIAFIIYGIGLFLLYHFTKLIPKLGVVILAGLPILVKVLLFFVALYEERSLFENLVVIGYVIFLYLLVMLLYKDETSYIKYIIKSVAYTIAILIIYIDLTLGSETLALSVTLVGIAYLLYQRFEPDIDVAYMRFYGYIFGWSWVAFLIIYAMSIFDRGFVWYALGLDMLSLVILWYALANLKLKHVIIKLTILTFTFAILIYMNVIDLSFGEGLVTILYALYSIGVLIVSVIKANKQMVTYGLVLIILVALKFVIVDLATVLMIWKIVISMGFGSALLILSYYLQPLLSKTTPSEEK